MKKQREFDNHIIRSDSRIRESVRSLPKGHFQQIRQMFDKQTNSTRKLSTIYERQQKSLPSHDLLHLPVTDDEKMQHTTAKIEHERSLEERYRDYLAEYQAFRLKLTSELNQHKTMYPTKENAQLLKPSVSLPDENHSNQKSLSYATSLPVQISSSSIGPTSQLNQNRSLAMSAAVNYTDSYDSSLSNQFNRTGSSRQYVSSLQHTLTVHAKPVAVTTPITCNVLKRNPPITSNQTYPSIPTSRRLHSSNSLSSTGYDSNSSLSIKSKRNSIATNNSNDFIIHSTCSSSASSSSSDELHQQQSLKPWIQYESNPSIYHDEAFESSNEPSPLISRTQIQLNQPTSFEQRPTTIIRHDNHRNSSSSSSSLHEPIIIKKPINNSSFIVQTTSFPDNTNEKVDRKIRRWNNVHVERAEVVNAPTRTRKYPLASTTSTGFQVVNSNNELPVTSFTPIIEQKPINEREESSLPVLENPIYNQLPPKKPPRTFKHEGKDDPIIKATDQKIPSSSSSNSNSPIFDIGTRSVSCMDLTAGVSNTLLSNGLLPIEHVQNRFTRRTSVISEKKRKSSVPNENPSEELKTSKNDPQQFSLNPSHPPSKSINKSDIPVQTRTAKSKTTMKKGISEPNLTKRSRSKSPFSPRGLIDRFKRILPTSLSKQSLNANDSDDSASTSSDTTDHLRTSRLDHVSRVKNVYDSLSISNHMSNLFIDPNLRTSTEELTNLYDYVVQILPEQEFGYFANGNGCMSSSNIHHHQSSSIIFKYPPDANDEMSLKYFCFPDQHDSNNNPLSLTKKSAQEYFRFTLTNMHGRRRYGYCSRFFHKGKLNALCLVSPYDMMEIYEKILATTTELFLSYKDEDGRKFLEEIYAHRLPNRGDTIHIDTTTVGLYTLKCEFDRRKELIDSVTLLSLSTDTIIKIFSSILYEQKIIFIGNDLGPLTRLINTFVCLLYPFSWPHTYVPILPALMLDIIQAPTPYIIGILRSCESYLSANDDLISQDNSDILIVDIDHDRVRSLNDYLTNGMETSSHLPFENNRFQILPKIFKIELKQEISLLRKTKLSLSLDDCQQRLRDVFMSIFVQSCYNYKDYFHGHFQREDFLQSKQHTIELFLEWFTRTQIFELFIRKKFDGNDSYPFAITFDLACEKYGKTLNKQTQQRITAKSVKRKSATRANKQN